MAILSAAATFVAEEVRVELTGDAMGAPRRI